MESIHSMSISLVKYIHFRVQEQHSTQKSIHDGILCRRHLTMSSYLVVSPHASPSAKLPVCLSPSGLQFLRNGKDKGMTTEVFTGEEGYLDSLLLQNHFAESFSCVLRRYQKGVYVGGRGRIILKTGILGLSREVREADKMLESEKKVLLIFISDI